MSEGALAHASGVRRVKVWFFLWVRDPSWKAVGRQEAVEADREVTNGWEPSMPKGGASRSASDRAVTRVNVEQAPKTQVAEADPPPERGRPLSEEHRTILGLRIPPG